MARGVALSREGGLVARTATSTMSASEFAQAFAYALRVSETVLICDKHRWQFQCTQLLCTCLCECAVSVLLGVMLEGAV